MSCCRAVAAFSPLIQSRVLPRWLSLSKPILAQQQRRPFTSKSVPEMNGSPPAKMACVEQAPLLKCKKLSENAVLPTRGSVDAAGYDLYSAYDVKIPAQGKALVKTDLAVALPEGCYGRVAPRSGLAWKHHLDCGAGVIDRDYRGNVGVILFNLAQNEYEVKAGDRVAQLVLERIMTPPVAEVEDLDSTCRGAGGFGSTGRN